MRDTQLRQNIQDRALEIIGAFVRLRRQGKQYVSLCPFHTETRPSFSVSPEKGVFHCFGCGAGGDSLSFLMRLKGLIFPEALAEATRLLRLPPPQPPPDSSPRRACATPPSGQHGFLCTGSGNEKAHGDDSIYRNAGLTTRPPQPFVSGFIPIIRRCCSARWRRAV